MTLNSKQKSRSMKIVREAKRFANNLIHKVQVSQILNIILQKSTHRSEKKSTSVEAKTSRTGFTSQLGTTPRVQTTTRKRKVSNFTTNTNFSRRRHTHAHNQVRVQSEGLSFTDYGNDSTSKSRIMTGAEFSNYQMEGKFTKYLNYEKLKKKRDRILRQSENNLKKKRTKLNILQGKLKEAQYNETEKKRPELHETDKITVKKTITEKTEYVPQQCVHVSNHLVFSPSIVRTAVVQPNVSRIRYFSPALSNQRISVSPNPRRVTNISHQRISLSPQPIITAVRHHRISVSPQPRITKISTKVTRTEEIEIPKVAEKNFDEENKRIGILEEKVNRLIFKNYLRILKDKVKRARYQAWDRMKTNLENFRSRERRIPKPEPEPKIIIQKVVEKTKLNKRFKGFILQNLFSKFLKMKRLNRYLMKWNLYSQRHRKKWERKNNIVCSESRLERFVKLLKTYLENRPLKNTYHSFNKIKNFSILKNLKDIEEIEIVKKVFDMINDKQNLRTYLTLKRLIENKNYKMKDSKIQHQELAIKESIYIFKNRTEENLKKMIESEKKNKISRLGGIISKYIEINKRTAFEKIIQKTQGKYLKIKNFFEKILEKNRMKTYRTFSELQKFNLESRIPDLSLYFKSQNMNSFLNTKFKTKNLNSTTQAFKALKEAYYSSKFQTQLLKEKQKRIFEKIFHSFSSKQSQAFRRLIMNRNGFSAQMLKALKLEKILSTVFKKHSYHSFSEIMKSAFKYKEGYKFCTVLEKIFLKNSRSAFDKIFDISEYRRFSKIYKGLQIIHKIFNIKYLINRKEFKRLILVRNKENKWYIRAVRKLTVQAPLNHQTTFWKLREIARIELDKKGDYIKRKKLLFKMVKIFKNLRLRQLGLCFVKIDTTANFMEIGGFASPQLVKREIDLKGGRMRFKSDTKVNSTTISIMRNREVECPSNDSEISLENKRIIGIKTRAFGGKSWNVE